MSVKSINVERKLTLKMTRKLIRDNMFKITIPVDWATFFKLKKGQVVELRLEEEGFFVKILTEPSEIPTKT